MSRLSLDALTERDLLGRRFHFVGIGGISMSALARVLMRCGAVISGSDLHASELTDLLAELGAAIFIGHCAEQAQGAEFIIYSDAVPRDNPELAWARAHQVPVYARSKLLGWLMRQHRSIAIAGTHGKTTTSAMIAWCLEVAGRDPTVLLGGELSAIGGNAKLGQGPELVAEACEAYDSFLDLQPDLAVVLNIEAEHLDHHHTESALKESFVRFLSQTRPGGAAVLCWDRPELRELAETLAVPVIKYGLQVGEELDFSAARVTQRGLTTSFELLEHGRLVAEITIAVPGEHNLLNALATIAASRWAGIEFADLARALSQFRGVKRRFEIMGEAGGVTVVDDYAHHPTEIRATLAAARTVFTGRITAIFQPHLYSRTRDFLDEFADSFKQADRAIITDIYPAREQPIPGVSAEAIVTLAHQRQPTQDIRFLAPKEVIAQQLAPQLQAGEIAITLGAGDVYLVARNLLAELSRK